jgi:hypothetical protein
VPVQDRHADAEGRCDLTQAGAGSAGRIAEDDGYYLLIGLEVASREIRSDVLPGATT